HSPKQDLSQERLHGVGSEESFVPHCPRREWSSLEQRDLEKSPAGVSAREKANQSNLRAAPPLSWPFALCPWREWSRLEGSDMDKARRGRSAGALRSIEPSCGPTTKLPTIWHIAECPRREWSRRERRDIDEARRASAWVM